ncbi:MAG TPA: endonuclease/exonuclease/phosphatase family protein [Chthoniobacterales bacterium]
MNLFIRFSFSCLVPAFFILVVAGLQPVRGEQVVTFAHYNVENYLVLDRREHGHVVHAGKPEAEIAPLIRIIQTIHPDLLGVAEMGPPDQFDDFRQRLAAAGLEYPAAEYVQGADPDRHLAFLSKFPILERHSEADAEVILPDHREPMRRGILDVTVEITPRTRIRLVGAHLKSKLPIPEGEELVRRAEAQKLREHIDGLLQQAPDTLLLVYGDLNDTKDEPAIREVAGIRENPTGLLDLWLADQDGDRWTYYRKFSDTYARIDYIFVNRALFPSIDRAKSYLFRSADWNRASDHRPVVATLTVAD